MTRFCVKKPYTVFVAAILVIVMGFVSLTEMQTDLLPNMSMPYLMVISTYPGASPERVESDVTQPLESTLGTVTGVKNVTSTSSENYGMVMLEFEEETNMDSAMVKVSSAINEVESLLPEECGTPSIMEISMDMLATMYVSVSYDGYDIYEISKFAEETAIPGLERVNGVANISQTGLIEKSVEIRLDEEKIDALNDKILAQVDEKFAEAKEEMEKAKEELAKGEEELKAGYEEIESSKVQLQQSQDALNQQANETYEQLAQASQALSQLTSYQTQLTNQQAKKQAVETARKKAIEQLETNGMKYETLDASLEEAQNGLTMIKNSLTRLTSADELIDNALKIVESGGEIPAEMLQQLETLLGSPVDVSGTPEETAMKLKMTKEGLAAQISDLEAKKTEAENGISAMKQAKTAIDGFAAEITAADVEIAVTQEIIKGYEDQLKEQGVSYTDIEKAKMEAAAGFGSAQAQISSGQTALESAQQQLDAAKAQVEEGKTQLEEAEKNYEETRKQAVESANLDQLLNLQALSGIIYAQNFSMPAGYIDDKNDEQWMLRIGEEYETVEELSEMFLVTMDSIGDVRLKDVAQITVLDNSGESYAKANGEEAIILSIYKSSTVGTNDVSDNLKETFAQLEAKYPGLHFTVFMDQGDYIDIIIDSLFSNLLWGALLAMIILLIFLRDFRPTIVVAFSIPFSVLFTVVLMYFSGISMNMLSLSGLALGIGMLVDNSVVVIENIYRLRSRGVSIGRAAVQGAKQVAGAIAASTLTTVCVFLPLVFSSGLTRELLSDMGLTITYSLLASLVVALTVVPTMSNTILRKSQPKEHKLFDKMLIGYRKALEFCLKVKIVPIAISIVLLVVSVVTVLNMGIVLIPDIGTNQMQVTLTVSEETEREEAYSKADRVIAEALNIESIETVGAMSSAATASIMGGGTESTDHTSYTFFIMLDEKADVDAVAEQLSAALSDMECEELIVSTSASASMTEMLGSGLSINLYGNDLEQLLTASEELMAIVDQVEGFTEISNGQEESKEVVHLTIDQDQAMEWGLTTAQIYQQIAGVMTSEATATTVTVDGNDMDVLIVDERDPLTVENLLKQEFEVSIMQDDGTSVTETHTLEEMASVVMEPGVASISRENQSRYITVTAAAEEGYNVTLLSRELEELLEDYEAPDGVKMEIGGETESVEDMIWQMMKMIALAVVFIYLIMVAQFQSLLSPFIVIFTLPLAFTGGMLALIIAGENLSLMSLMGFLLLAGVIVNNGIVYVDYTNQLRYGGLGKKEALIAAGCTRMRPILMTTLTTVFAMMVMLFSKDLGSALGRGLALVVVGGLLYATLMTLFIVPVMYDIFFRRKDLKEVDVGDHDMDELPDDAQEFAEMFRQEAALEVEENPQS